MGTLTNLGLHRCHLPHGHRPHFFSHWCLCLLLLFGLFLLLEFLYVSIIDLPLGKGKMRKINAGQKLQPVRSSSAFRSWGVDHINPCHMPPHVGSLYLAHCNYIFNICLPFQPRTEMKELSGQLWAGLSVLRPRGLAVSWRAVLFQPTVLTRQNKWANIRLAHIILVDLYNYELEN